MNYVVHNGASRTNILGKRKLGIWGRSKPDLVPRSRTDIVPGRQFHPPSKGPIPHPCEMVVGPTEVEEVGL